MGRMKECGCVHCGERIAGGFALCPKHVREFERAVEAGDERRAAALLVPRRRRRAKADQLGLRGLR